MTTQTQSPAIGDNSVILLFDQAKEAALLNRVGVSKCDKAQHAAVYVLCQLWASFERQVIVKDKDDGVLYSRIVSLDIASDKANPPKNRDGSTCRQAQGAIIAMIALEIFGLDAEHTTAADRAFIGRCLSLARNIVVKVDPEQVTLSKRGSLQVPMSVMVDAPDPAKAKESVIEDYERNSDKPFTLDSLQGERSLANLARRVAPPIIPRLAQPVQDDKGASFVGSLKLVLACVQSFTNAEGECDIAPTREIDELMHDIMIASQAYFTTYEAYVEVTKVA